MKTKVCNKCKIEKSISDFWKESRNKDKLKSRCIICLKTQRKEYYDKNKDKFNEKRREEYAENPDLIKKKVRESYQRRRESAVQQKRDYRKKNKKKLNKRKSEFGKKYPHVIRARNKATHTIKVSPGIERHHWCYKEGYELDVIFLNRAQHLLIHGRMKPDENYFYYIDENGNTLDTLEKHHSYINKILYKNK